MTPRTSARSVLRGLAAAALVLAAVWVGPDARAQEITPEMLDEAARRSGMSREQILDQIRQESAAGDTTARAPEPGRTVLGGIDDARPWRDTDVQVVLPAGDLAVPLTTSTEAEEETSAADPDAFFGASFFRLDSGVFQPPSFGPVPADYGLGVGDEIIINVWGAVDLQLTRVVDRDGSIILPTVGKIACAGRTLKAVDKAIRAQLARTHASIDVDGAGGAGEGDTFVEVTLGHLRAIRVAVVGEAVRPGSYELSSVSTIMTALHAAGGPTELGSFREIRLVRGDKTVATLDVYDFLLGGTRGGDVLLREGDTVFIPDRGRSVTMRGGVRRPIRFEMRPGEQLGDLVRFAGGFLPTAAPEIIHIRRILPLDRRRAGQPDLIFLDVPFDAARMTHADGSPVPLLDGDTVTVDQVGSRLENWVRIAGKVKRPGDYEFRPGMTALDLIEAAEGLWPDALTEHAVIDRTSPEGHYSSVAFPLGEVLAGGAAPLELKARDVLRVFGRWDTQNRPQVHITGEVNDPLTVDFREGMTLRDLILRAGGFTESANLLEAEVSRTNMEMVSLRSTEDPPDRVVDVLTVPLGDDFLARDETFALAPYDRVAIRRLPWWQAQKTVSVRGEVFFPGVFSLERGDERISSVIARAGGLTPDAYATGARIVRSQDGVGNIAVDLDKALDKPGTEHDIILQTGDVIVIPDHMFTVKVVGEVGWPTSLVWQKGKDINWYVERAGGYLKKSDKKRARVVWPNGKSLPNKGGSKVVAGSTIIVPVKPPPEGKTTIETIRDISSIVASLAMVYLVVENTTRNW